MARAAVRWLQASYNPILGVNGKPVQSGEVRHRRHRTFQMQKGLDARLQEAQAVSRPLLRAG